MYSLYVSLQAVSSWLIHSFFLSCRFFTLPTLPCLFLKHEVLLCFACGFVVVVWGGGVMCWASCVVLVLASNLFLVYASFVVCCFVVSCFLGVRCEV